MGIRKFCDKCEKDITVGKYCSISLRKYKYGYDPVENYEYKSLLICDGCNTRLEGDLDALFSKELLDEKT